jgi:hypothetical protein
MTRSRGPPPAHLVLGSSADHCIALDQLDRSASTRRELARVAVVQRADRRTVGGAPVQRRLAGEQALHERQCAARQHQAYARPLSIPAVPVSLHNRRQRRLGHARVLELVDHNYERSLACLNAEEFQCRVPGVEAQGRRARQQPCRLGGERRELRRSGLLIGLIADNALAVEGVCEQKGLADPAPSAHHDQAWRRLTLVEQPLHLLLAVYERSHHLERQCYRIE